MIKRLIEKLKTLRLYFASDNEVSVGCATCEHIHLSMSDKPCLNCTGRYSEWKQPIDYIDIELPPFDDLDDDGNYIGTDVSERSEQLVCPNCGSYAIDTTHNDKQHDCFDCGESWTN